MKSSIIIPVYNVERFISECLDSVIRQTGPENLECILVDDCGTDGSMAIAEKLILEYKGPISFLILRHRCNRGLSAARNTGMRAAKGDYIYFLDSDDILAPDAMKAMAAPLKKRDYDMVAGEYTVIEGEDVFMHLSMPEGECVGREKIIEAKRRNRWYPMAWGKLYRRAFLEENGLEFREGILHEDELFSVEAACLMQSSYFLPSCSSYVYRQRPGSIMTASQYERRRESCEKMLSYMHNFLSENSLTCDPASNDLLYYLFSYANEVSWRYSKDEYNRQYARYRKLVCRHYGERLLSDKRLRAVIRDLHFLFPEKIGRTMFRLMALK